MKRKNLEKSRNLLKEAYVLLNNIQSFKINEIKKNIIKSIKNIDEQLKSTTISENIKINPIVSKTPQASFVNFSYNKNLKELNDMIKEQEKKLIEIQQKKDKPNEDQEETFLLD